jgi:hypothetical protein
LERLAMELFERAFIAAIVGFGLIVLLMSLVVV